MPDPSKRHSIGWRGTSAYLALIACGVGLFLLVKWIGTGLESAGVNAVTESKPSARRVDVVLHVIATLAAVIALGTILGRLLRVIGQPAVIGEVLAGIMLGPSLLGAISPDAMHWLIPPADVDPNGQVTAALSAVSQIGVILYMFLVGLELNAPRLRHQAHSALAVAHTSMVVPFVLGSFLAIGLYSGFAPRGVPFSSFALFMGAAMSVTAFPVLARILTDRKMEKTELGIVALGCAAADDVTAWCLLALVVGLARSQLGNVGWVIGAAIGFIAMMFLVVNPFLARLMHRLERQPGPLEPFVVSCVFLGLLVSSLITEAIGIHAVIGAFLLGVILPHEGKVAREFTAKLKDPVIALLLPAFFAITGMRTQIGLLGSWSEWMWCGVIILAATVGKLGGTMTAARLTGLNWQDSIALGALMNTRGLMALVVLNIGLEMGVLSPTLFSMMVVMAVVTTAATTPILQLVSRTRTS